MSNSESSVQQENATIFRGVVRAGGVGGVGISGEWKLVFHFAAWESESDPFSESELRVEMPISQKEIALYREKFSSYDVIEIRGKKGIHQNGSEMVHMTEFIGKITDEKLTAFSKELQKPVIIRDETLGNLTLDRSINVFEGETNWLHGKIRVTFSADEGPIEPLLPTAHAICSGAAAWDRKTKEYAAEQLLELKNDSWLDDDEEEISRDQFTDRLKLTSITIEGDRSCAFWFDDGDLFWGHWICVTLDPEGKFVDAEMMG